MVKSIIISNMLNKFNYISQKPVIYFWAIFSIAFFVRLVFLFIFDGFDRNLSGDEGAYHERAVQIVSGDFLGSSERPPLLGVLIAPIYLITDNNPIYARLLVVFVSSLSASCLFVFANLFINRYSVSVCCALIWVFYPPSIWYSTWILTESLSSLLIILLAIYIYKFINKTSYYNALFCGIFFGLLAINRTVYLFLPVFVLLFWIGYLCLFKRSFNLLKYNLNIMLLGLIAFLIILSPWVAHNMILHGQFIPHSTQGGHLLLVSNGMLDNSDVKSGKYTKDILNIPALINEGSLNSYEFDLIKREIALNTMKTHISDLPEPVVNRVKNFWTSRPDPYDSVWTINDSIMAIIWTPIMIFFIIGICSIPIRVTLPILLVILYACFMVIPFWGSPRFRFPVDALIIVTAFLGVLRTNIFGWNDYMVMWSLDNE